MANTYRKPQPEKLPKNPKKPSHCPVAARCGGCQLGHLTYPEQLKHKQQKVEKLLGKLCKVEPILGMDDPLHYRCKVSSAMGFSRGRVISGVWQSSGRKLVTVEHCALEDMRAEGIAPLYLVTDHAGFYERYGWEFLCMVQGDGEPEMTRMYIHR